jgi:hypothetical protein
LYIFYILNLCLTTTNFISLLFVWHKLNIILQCSFQLQTFISKVIVNSWILLSELSLWIVIVPYSPSTHNFYVLLSFFVGKRDFTAMTFLNLLPQQNQFWLFCWSRLSSLWCCCLVLCVTGRTMNGCSTETFSMKTEAVTRWTGNLKKNSMLIK